MKSIIEGVLIVILVTIGSLVGAMGIIYGLTQVFGDEVEAASTDTIVNIEAHQNDFGDQFIVIKPAEWAQPVYGIWVTSTCASTLSLGDSWPSSC